MKRTVEALLAQYETKTLKAKLLEFPALIQTAKSQTHKVRTALKQAESERAAAEAEITIDVAAEIGGNGKPRFTNAEARAAEVARRKALDIVYSGYENDVRQAEWDLNEAQSELERLQDEFKAYRYVVRLTTAELALLVDDVEAEETATGSNDVDEPF